MATAAVGFLGSNLVRKQQQQRAAAGHDKRISSWRVECSRSDGEPNEELDMAKLLALVLQTEESKGLLKDLDSAVQRVENAKRELTMMDELEQQNKKNAAGRMNDMKSQQMLIDECESELAAAKIEAKKAELALAAVGASAERPTANAERIECGKAALVAAAAGVFASLPFVLAESGTISLATFVSEGAVLVSCAAFGVTFRYALRKDLDNVQLKAGSAAAFALARGLGQADALQKLAGWDDLLAGSVTYIGQSFVIFLSAAAALDLCYRTKLIQKLAHFYTALKQSQ